MAYDYGWCNGTLCRCFYYVNIAYKQLKYIDL